MNLGLSIGVSLLVAVALIALSVTLSDAKRPVNSDSGEEISNGK